MLSYKESDNNQVVILQQGNKERPTHAPVPLSLLSFVTCSCRRLYLRIESTDLVTGDESGGTGGGIYDVHTPNARPHRCRFPLLVSGNVVSDDPHSSRVCYLVNIG